MRWYAIISSAPPGDFSSVPDALEWFEREIEDLRISLKAEDIRLEELEKKVPGYAEYYYGHFQDLTAIKEFLEIQLLRATQKARKSYNEHYNKALSDRQVEKYAEADEDVLTVRLIINEVVRVRNKMEGVTRRVEYLHYQLSNITKLRVAGIEDARI